jgi:hypothetical protein
VDPGSFEAEEVGAEAAGEEASAAQEEQIAEEEVAETGVEVDAADAAEATANFEAEKMAVLAAEQGPAAEAQPAAETGSMAEDAVTATAEAANETAEPKRSHDDAAHTEE